MQSSNANSQVILFVTFPRYLRKHLQHFADSETSFTHLECRWRKESFRCTPVILFFYYLSLERKAQRLGIGLFYEYLCVCNLSETITFSSPTLIYRLHKCLLEINMYWLSLLTLNLEYINQAFKINFVNRFKIILQLLFSVDFNKLW